MFIYKITNKANGKIYIGQTTKTIYARFNKHWHEATYAGRPNNYFHNSLKKYGRDSFLIEEIEECESIEELNLREAYWIKELNTTDKNIGYNLMSGGKSGLKNEATKKIISDKKKLNWQNPEIASKMYAGLEKATQAWSSKCEERRVKITCAHCKNIFFVPPFEQKTRVYCSVECATMVNIAKATKAAARNKIEKTKDRNALIQKDAKEWALLHQQLILTCPLNRISTTLKGLELLILDKYGISDWRSISLAICGAASKKELLNYLRNFVKIYAEPDQN